jgi:undecaprenyl-diphosphatase
LIPLVIVYPFLSTIKEVYNRPDLLGFFFLLTACLLFIGEWSALRRVSFQTTKSYKQSFIVGIFQVLALLPGVSRSGSTISGGRLLGWNFETALNFSFLLAIPTILGGCLVEVKELLSNPLPSTIPLSSYFVGFFSSFIVGYLCFSWLLKQKLKHPFIGFGVYSLLLGVICLIFL